MHKQTYTLLLLFLLPLSFVISVEGKQLKQFGKDISDDDVRHAITVACMNEYHVASYYCKLALAPYLLNPTYNQLLGPMSCKCDKQCPLPLALSCATKTTECLEDCKRGIVGNNDCLHCVHEVVGPHCCPCLSYGVGIIHGKHIGKLICEHCPPVPEPVVHCEEPCEGCTSDMCENDKCNDGTCDEKQQTDEEGTDYQTKRAHWRQKMQNKFEE